MRIIQTNSYEEMSVRAAGLLAAQVLLKPGCVLGLATGSSPVGTYQELIRMCEKGLVDFTQVKTVNLDEYCGLESTNPQSYRYFMNKTLFEQINIDLSNTYLPDGMAQDAAEESKRYQAQVEKLGGADLQLLGIGQNGHIGFNEPNDFFTRDVHEEKLTQSTINANSRLFGEGETVPTTAITMGIGNIMKAGKIVLIAGADKKDIIEEALYGPVTPKVPASVLQLHKDVTVITVQ